MNVLKNAIIHEQLTNHLFVSMKVKVLTYGAPECTLRAEIFDWFPGAGGRE